jgi:hypothetical protein
MKTLTYLLLTSLIILSSCGGIKTKSVGLENEAFLEFVGPVNSYPGGVDVSIDNKINFKAVVHKDKVAYMKGEVYAISTGTHILKVIYNGQVLFEKQIFIAAQETKKIVLQ